jgi:very-short-patch-repair endonuclease
MGRTGKGQGVTGETPLPLEGEGAGGWGEGATPQNVAQEAAPLSSRFANPSKVSPRTSARAKRLRSEPTQTETMLWARLRKLDAHFRRQAPLGPYVVDFACLSARLVLEVDGGVHNRTDLALRDLERDAWLNAEGFQVLRIPTDRVRFEIDAVIAEIEATVAASRAMPRRRPATTPSQPFPLEGKGLSAS